MAELRRMRPILGTFVEIRASAAHLEALELAVHNAFYAINKVQELMSYYESSSDISRLNTQAYLGPITVDIWTLDVLRAALNLFTLSNGLFDPCVAGALAADGLLPKQDLKSFSVDPLATAADIEILADGKITFQRPLLLDFGGIAKGFAVDRAIDALIAGGAENGIVNAGGDLRVFGPRAEQITVRHPAQARGYSSFISLQNEAIASSADTFSRQRVGRKKVSALRNPKTGASAVHDLHVSVCAPECMYADALTKCVHADYHAALPLLDTFHARTWLIDGSGEFVDPNE